MTEVNPLRFGKFLPGVHIPIVDEERLFDDPRTADAGVLFAWNYQDEIIPKLRERVREGMPVWGTCAGAIFLAKDVPGHPHPLAAVMDIAVERNAFGRQVDSFEADLDVKGMSGAPYHAVFIRAPKITKAAKDVETLATLDDGSVVAARQGKLLATSFHPELTRDDRFHRLFLSLGKR